MELLTSILVFALVVPSIVLHEMAHGYAALRLGDTTAKDAGRLSFNPLAHIDPWGTVLLPLLMSLTIGIGFGYAKPVPINPWRFKDYRKGMFITGIAGPTTNLALAVCAGIGVRAVDLLAPGLSFAADVMYILAIVNLSLMFFNLIPIPPLDGSRVLPLFLSNQQMVTYAKAERYGFLVLILVLWLVPRYLHIDPIGIYFNLTVNPVLGLLTGRV